MGDIQRHHVTHHLSAELRDLLKAAVVILGKLEPPPAPAAADPEPEPDRGPKIEHWAFHEPQIRRDVVAFLDPQNQVRHVEAARAHEVPSTWRRIFIEVSE